MASHVGLFVAAVFLIAAVLWDTFETMILPRRVTRGFRLVRFFYRSTWIPWSIVARCLHEGKRRESFLSFFGPLSLLLLFGVWAFGLIFGFALLHWSLGSPLIETGGIPGFWTDLYLSGTTFFTLGLGDVTPATTGTRVITVIESGLGFGFLAIVVSYLPVLYGAFSRRETNISMMDAHAGSPPTAGELLQRHLHGRSAQTLDQYLHDWETWSAELMESHLSYPILCYFRSQHNNQSWLAAMTTVLDLCALMIAYAEGELRWQARMTFAISRHALVDLTAVLRTSPKSGEADRLSEQDLLKLRKLLAESHLPLRSGDACDQKFSRLRKMYEPYLYALSHRLLMSIPPWTLVSPMDNWRIGTRATIEEEFTTDEGES